MKPIWAKTAQSEVDPEILAFTAGDDLVLDREFFAFDVLASRAHVGGLARAGLLEQSEAEALDAALAAIGCDFASGRFVLDAAFEDGHSALEHELTQRVGDVGGKVHLGRSRNDQVLAATRLWLRDRLTRTAQRCLETADVALRRATEPALAMPGYTHLQRAVVSSTAMWWQAFAEAFVDNADRALVTRGWIDASPLGTAAGFGVNLLLDRDGVAGQLGFGRLLVSPIYAQLSRGKFEIAAIEALASAALDLRRLAWDLSLFASAEYGFVELPARYCTGSSIMPNKSNPDVVELMRAVYPSISAARCEIEQLLSLPSGYHRDLQVSKGALFHAFHRGLPALGLLPGLLADLQWRPAAMQAAIDPGMFATDAAVEAAKAGKSFRDAYRSAQGSLPSFGADPAASLAARVSPGAAADPLLDRIAQRRDTIAAQLAELGTGD